MKKLIFSTLLFLMGIATQAQVAMKVNTLATLKQTNGADGMVAIMIGTNSVVDNNSGFYYWNATSTATPDDISIIQSTDPQGVVVTIGRWLLIKSISVKAGSYVGNGISLTSAYVVTHGLGAVPNQVFIQPTSANAAVINWISNKTATTFTVNFSAIPIVGTNNISFDWLVRL